MLRAFTLLAFAALPAIAQEWPVLAFKQVFSGLTAPTHIAGYGGRLFIVQQTGQIRIAKGGSLLPTPFLDSPLPRDECR